MVCKLIEKIHKEIIEHCDYNDLYMLYNVNYDFKFSEWIMIANGLEYIIYYDRILKKQRILRLYRKIE